MTRNQKKKNFSRLFLQTESAILFFFLINIKTGLILFLRICFVFLQCFVKKIYPEFLGITGRSARFEIEKLEIVFSDSFNCLHSMQGPVNFYLYKTTFTVDWSEGFNLAKRDCRQDYKETWADPLGFSMTKWPHTQGCQCSLRPKLKPTDPMLTRIIFKSTNFKCKARIFTALTCLPLENMRNVTTMVQAVPSLLEIAIYSHKIYDHENKQGTWIGLSID
jgi:hypothetical protein